MKQVDESIDKSPLSGKSAKEIIEHFKSYNFVDDHGHRLDMCLDFTDLVEMATASQSEENTVLRVSFEEAAKPLIKWLAENVHPHHTVIVTSTSAELLEGSMSFQTEEYLKD